MRLKAVNWTPLDGEKITTEISKKQREILDARICVPILQGGQVKYIDNSHHNKEGKTKN
jgi:hypothetical protein